MKKPHNHLTQDVLGLHNRGCGKYFSTAIARPLGVHLFSPCSRGNESFRSLPLLCCCWATLRDGCTWPLTTKDSQYAVEGEMNALPRSRAWPASPPNLLARQIVAANLNRRIDQDGNRGWIHIPSRKASWLVARSAPTFLRLISHTSLMIA